MNGLLRPKNDYWKNIEYLESSWSEKEVLNFIEEVDYSRNLLAKGNVIFTKSDYTCLQNGNCKTNYYLLFY